MATPALPQLELASSFVHIAFLPCGGTLRIKPVDALATKNATRAYKM
jgi:hypothetical protein